MSMRKKHVRLLAIFAAFCVAFTSLPMLTGGLDSHAASSYIKTLNAAALLAGIAIGRKKRNEDAKEEA